MESLGVMEGGPKIQSNFGALLGKNGLDLFVWSLDRIGANRVSLVATKSNNHKHNSCNYALSAEGSQAFDNILRGILPCTDIHELADVGVLARRCLKKTQNKKIFGKS